MIQVAHFFLECPFDSLPNIVPIQRNAIKLSIWERNVTSGWSFAFQLLCAVYQTPKTRMTSSLQFTGNHRPSNCSYPGPGPLLRVQNHHVQGRTRHDIRP